MQNCSNCGRQSRGDPCEICESLTQCESYHRRLPDHCFTLSSSRSNICEVNRNYESHPNNNNNSNFTLNIYNIKRMLFYRRVIDVEEDRIDDQLSASSSPKQKYQRLLPISTIRSSSITMKQLYETLYLKI